MFAWIALALLSVSWLPGLGYYHLTSWLQWAVLVALGCLSLVRRGDAPPSRTVALVALGLSIPALVIAPWPDRAAFVLLAAGFFLAAAYRPSAPFFRACLLAGCVLLVQAVVMEGYQAVTARSHELPSPLPQVLGGAARLLGIDAAASGSTIALFSMRETHQLGATWELFLDPASCCFFAAALVYFAWQSSQRPAGRRKGAWLKSLAVLAAIAIGWLPMRSALLMALYLHQVLRTDYDAPLGAMAVFWNTWIHLLLLFPPAVLLWRFAPLGRKTVRPADAPAAGVSSSMPINFPPRKAVLSVLLLAVGAGVITFGFFWDPVGQRAGGRILVEEYVPEGTQVWERTDKPFDTEWYGHLSAYNYYCIFDYCSRFYDYARLAKPLDAQALEKCDVLVLKTPTRDYSPDEIAAVVDFVERGGGLLLIGEHTNVFGTGTRLNALARRFGFEFRYDCLFGVDKVYDDYFAIPLAPHPLLQYMPDLDFATSCSIEPHGPGRAAIRGRGLKNLGPDYHVPNFYPQPNDRADMRYGAFVQLWAARHGQGRVAAFTDSTIFSNFSAFEPGKSELMLGMIEWLNHRGGSDRAWLWLAVLGAVPAALGVWRARDWPAGFWVLLAAASLGWAGGALAAQAAHRAAMPPPPQMRPMVQVVVDRTICDTPLPKGGFIAGKDDEFGIFERWILRLGCFTAREAGAEALKGDLLVFLHPHLPLADRFGRNASQLEEYLKNGGRILIVDSAKNEHSTADELLKTIKVDLAVEHKNAKTGTLRTAGKWPEVPVENACEVRGGEPFAWIGDAPVGATCRVGKGSITVVGFGSRFTDANAGVTGDAEPNADLRKIYDLQFSLFRWILAPSKDPPS
ncbi:MAG: hypothetical protein IT426_06595 [Pirellulales bacterium]|nr:hypothetical protein [Pirellulales bacterium]